MDIRKPPLSRRWEPFLLATDLDGTFLGGSEQDRHTLYTLIDSQRHLVRLLFVTGRSFENTRALFETLPLPKPDLMICDVGSSVIDFHGHAPFATIQSEIATAWGNGQEIISAALADIAELELQTRTGPYRRSYFYRCKDAAHHAKTKVEALGYDGLLSDNQYFDVLPKGVNKGSTLKRVVAQFGTPHHRVLVAGDTLNDLSMLTSGFPAVAVSNSEPALLAALPAHPTLHVADRPGAGGILQAIEKLQADA